MVKAGTVNNLYSRYIMLIFGSVTLQPVVSSSSVAEGPIKKNRR